MLMAELSSWLDSVTSGADASSIGAGITKGMAVFWFWLKIILIMAAVVGICIFIYKSFFQYNKKITIHKRIGTGAVEVYSDRAKIVTDEQEKIKLVLWKTKKGKKQFATCPVPSAKYCGRLGRNDHYNLWLDDNFELHPIEPPKVEDNFQYLIIRPQERDAWGRMERDIIRQKFENKDFLLKYATPAILMTACITAFLIFFFASKDIGGGLSALADSFRQVASSCTKMG